MNEHTSTMSNSGGRAVILALGHGILGSPHYQRLLTIENFKLMMTIIDNNYNKTK